jgi:hypothetical protein
MNLICYERLKKFTIRPWGLIIEHSFIPPGSNGPSPGSKKTIKFLIQGSYPGTKPKF